MKTKYLLTYFITLVLTVSSILIVEMSPIMAKPAPQTIKDKTRESPVTSQPKDEVDNINPIVTPSPVSKVKTDSKPSNDFSLPSRILGSLSALLHLLEIAGMVWAYLKISQLSEKSLDSRGQIKNLTGRINAYEQKQKSQGDQLKLIGSDAVNTRNLASRLNEVELATKQKKQDVSYAISSYESPPSIPSVKSSMAASSTYPFLSIYYVNPENFKNQYAPKTVSEDAESVQNRRSGGQQDLFLSEERQGNYWLFNEGTQTYVIPNPKLKVNSMNIKIAASLFDCESYAPGCQSINIIRPAIVSFHSGVNECWKLERKGILEFT